MEKKSEIMLYEKIAEPITAIQVLGEMFASSGIFGCETKGAGSILAMQCLAERISPLDLARRYHIINGKLSMKADAMLGEFHNRGGKSEWIQFDTKAAICKFTTPDGKMKEISFTEQDAMNAGLLPAKPKSGWATFPDAMLRARCISKALRMLMPEIVSGMYTPEEVSDFDQPAKQPFKPIKPIAKTETVHDAVQPANDNVVDGEAKVIDMASQQQRQYINSLFKQANVNGKDDAILYIKTNLGIEVQGTAELTKEEASTLITILKAQETTVKKEGE